MQHEASSVTVPVERRGFLVGLWAWLGGDDGDATCARSLQLTLLAFGS